MLSRIRDSLRPPPAGQASPAVQPRDDRQNNVFAMPRPGDLIPEGTNDRCLGWWPMVFGARRGNMCMRMYMYMYMYMYMMNPGGNPAAIRAARQLGPHPNPVHTCIGSRRKRVVFAVEKLTALAGVRDHSAANVHKERRVFQSKGMFMCRSVMAPIVPSDPPMGTCCVAEQPSVRVCSFSPAGWGSLAATPYS